MTLTPDPSHFARAVTELGERRPVITRTAVFSAQGVKLVDEGVAVDRALYERLTQHALRTPLHDCVGSEPAVNGAMLRDAARQLCADEPLYQAMANDPKLRTALFDELSLVALPAPISFQLTLMHETQPEHWQHALRSAVVAAWLGSRQGASRHDLRQLATGGLLHNLGMLHLDPVLSQPKVELTSAQRRQLYSHPLVTGLLLEPHHDYSRELRQAVLEHHESLDGAGYPRQIGGERISPWGRILGLTELVTAIFAHGRPAPTLQLSLILRMSSRRYDPALVREVTALLARTAGAQPSVFQGDPQQALAQVIDLLARWPRSGHAGPGSTAAERSALGGPRAAVLDRVRELCDQVERVLASTGATDPQLALLSLHDAGGDDEAADEEMALIAREACWQLRSVSRQARRGWQLGAPEMLPDWLGHWLDEVDALSNQHLSY